VKYGYELLEQAAQQPHVALIIADVSLPDIAGPELIRQLKRLLPAVPIIAAIGARDEDSIRPVLKAGAVDYLRKGDSPARMATVIRNILTREATPQKTYEPADAFAALVGSSSPLQSAITSARQAANSDIPVIIKGESGVGKERFARAIHVTSARHAASFVAVNCGAIPPNLIESTLFGHEKGAFTGAITAAPGLFRQAEGGTLFLDEIGELPKDAQVTLLRTLQEKEVLPVGAKAPVPVDVRIISATHVDLERAVSDNRFREDLFYRLHVYPIEIPPLRKRGKIDITALAEHFIQRFAQQEDKPVRQISAGATELLTTYNWPGNIRQLENAMYRAVVSSTREVLGPDDFIAISNALQQLHYEEESKQAAPKSPVPQLSTAERKHMISLIGQASEFKTMQEIEGEVIERALQYYRWHITNIARALGMTRATIYKKMKAAGIEDPREKAG